MDKENIISTSNFKIEENTISFNDSLVQISNIAHIDVVPIPKPKLFQPWSVVVGVIGILMMFFESGGKIQILGVLLTLFAVIHNIFRYIIYFSDNEEKYLCIYLNSGHKYYIYCENNKFLKRVMQVMKDCINNHTKQKIKVNFNQCTLEGVPINIGNKKEVVNTMVTGKNSEVPINIYEKEVINSTVMADDLEVLFFIEDWTLVQDELKKACKKLPKSSKEYIASEEALKFAMNRDENGLFKVFNKYSEIFLSSLFKDIVGGVLVEIIKSMIL